ncbi:MULTISPECIES: virulence RhuM family protein [unclassified Sulfurimonas]|uniref:virulence RhuM family protein n=1 Tax=unclassified Sulfurimonas TaxID=2623549 RepID=UPI000A5913BE|nr:MULTISPECIES: virulence RhuM family protein [unclassified Sulfurimonas]
MSEIIIYSTNDGKTKLEVTLENETIWLNQKQISELYQKSKSTISEHISNIFEEEELFIESTVRKFRTVQLEGEREVEREVDFYSLDMIIAIGFRVRSRIGTQFRKWANETLKEYIVKGFVMDDERLKNPPVADSEIPDYFNEMLERIRDIRASERRMYLRVRDIFKIAADYNLSWRDTTKFFQTIQNKLLFAVSHLTAGELIATRADHTKPNMGLRSWGKEEIRSTDVTVGKNYLGEEEIEELNRIIVMWLDYAEDRAKKRKQVFLKEWQEKLDDFLEFNERDVLANKGQISKEEADKKAKNEYKLFSIKRREEKEKLGHIENIKLLESIAKGNKK